MLPKGGKGAAGVPIDILSRTRSPQPTCTVETWYSAKNTSLQNEDILLFQHLPHSSTKSRHVRDAHQTTLSGQIHILHELYNRHHKMAHHKANLKTTSGQDPDSVLQISRQLPAPNHR